jgi:hypothetical protein
MNTRSFIKGALLSAVVVATASTANAAPVTEAGETIGLALGAALPEGVYFVDTASYLSRSNSNISAVVNIPVVAWSTPWNFLGGHIEAYAAFPEDTLSTKGAGSGSGFYNPALLVGEAWDLGGGFHFSNFVGGYGPSKADGLASNNWVFNERPSIAWIAPQHWTLALNGIYGVVGKDLKTSVRATPDYLNLDFSALKTIGKWDFGPVAYYTTDTTNNTDTAGYQTNQFAIGAMVGYNFPGISTQLILTQDVSTSNLGGPNPTTSGAAPKDTRGFVRFIVPLY